MTVSPPPQTKVPSLILPNLDTPVLVIPIPNRVILPHIRSTVKLSESDFVKAGDAPWIVFTSVHGGSVMRIGTLCRVIGSNEVTTAVSVEGVHRVRIDTPNALKDGTLVHVSLVPDDHRMPPDAPVVKMLISEITTKLNELVKLTSTAKSSSSSAAVKFASTSPEVIGYIVMAAVCAMRFGVSAGDAQAVLESVELVPRLKLVSAALARPVEGAKITSDVNESIVRKHNSEMRRSLIKRQIAELENQLKSEFPTGGDEGEIEILKKRLQGLPATVERVVQKELKRLETLQPHHPEYPGISSYLETVASLPWKSEPAPSVDLAIARAALETNHYGLDTVKKRIIEFLAVESLTASGGSPHSVLCLCGGPGVGKTSIAESIATSMNRKFVRISLSGIRDESELRGHRKTYIGAMAGLVIQSLIRAGVDNPVILLDEVDKVTTYGRTGGASNVLLELLDPEQNKVFRDAYLNFGFDLSKCLFICTCNSLDSVSRPLLDRLEVVTISGYTEHEKVAIAKRHLVKKSAKSNGLDNRVNLELSDDVIRFIISHYTHESGVRSLARRLGDISRHYALKLVENSTDVPKSVNVSEKDVIEILGPSMLDGPVIPNPLPVGVSLGLAVSAVAGDVLFVESVITGRNTSGAVGSVTVTGQLGDVMKESVRACLSLLMNRALNRGSNRDSIYSMIDPAVVRQSDIHVHFPTGSIQKDGPSAGVSTSIALASLFAGVSARSNLASTGEITLRGDVLPIGGVKEKVLAAHRAGLSTVILPAGNKASLRPTDLPKDVWDGIELVFVKTIDEAMTVAFGSCGVGRDDSCDPPKFKSSAL